MDESELEFTRLQNEVFNICKSEDVSSLKSLKVIKNTNSFILSNI